jgi:ABC-type transport system substrate-binding protein
MPLVTGETPSARQYFYLQFINNLGSFASEVVRRAMSLTIKRELLQNYLVGASVKGGVGFYPRGSTTQDPLYLMAYQPRVAMQELQKNNFCVQPKAALNVPATNKDCKPLPVVEIQYPDFDVEKKLSLALCTIWHEELGIDCKTANQQSNIASDGNREVLHLHYIRPELPNLLSFLEQWSRYAGTPYNLLLRQLLAKPKTEQNLNWVRDLEKRLAQELPVIPLLESQSVSYVDPQVQGFYKNRLDIHPLKYVYFRTPTP